ncbi:hypothetical protein [Burkholderia cenocepacia]|uniref:hypothetical protein n=1 Tax=Burkholderia cenocepacia TaxID=95486 RepID=UPI002656582C|nr:hypothetical protein [Burkholderia cenocepacia]MDN7537037.1 hypothetical protein [Burkholderia cenocepacia]
MNAERWTRDQYIAHLSLLGWQPVWMENHPNWGRGIKIGTTVLWLYGEGTPAIDAKVRESRELQFAQDTYWDRLGYYYLEAFVRYLEKDRDGS